MDVQKWHGENAPTFDDWETYKVGAYKVSPKQF